MVNKRSIKTKLIWTLSLLITGALVLGGGIIIWQNAQQIQEEIYLDTLTFAELTNDDIINAFEQFYITENFLQYRKVLNPILGSNADVSRIELIGKSGELFYDSDTEMEVAYIGLQREQSYDLDRARNIKPSLRFADGTLVYTKQTAENTWLAVTENDEVIPFPKGEVVNVIYPHENGRIDIVFTLTYDALWERVYQMALSILAVIGLSIVVVSIVALYFANKLVKPIQVLEQGVKEIGGGALGMQVSVDSNDEIGVLAENFNAMSRRLKKDTEELLEKEALEKELNIAGEIQQSMLPKKSPELKGLDVAGYLNPATSIGGDIYDYVQHGENGCYIFIADVTGHGVPAGMVTNVTLASLYCFSKVYNKTDEIMSAMNAVVHAKTKPNMFATALLTHWDEQKKVLRYCNAGHEEVIHYQAATDNVSLVAKGGMALGMMADTSKLLKEAELNISSGDVLMFYTDGIPEAWKTEKENMGVDQMLEYATQAIRGASDARSINDQMIKLVTTYRSGYPQQDDITLVVIKVK